MPETFAGAAEAAQTDEVSAAPAAPIEDAAVEESADDAQSAPRAEGDSDTAAPAAPENAPGGAPKTSAPKPDEAAPQTSAPEAGAGAPEASGAPHAARALAGAPSALIMPIEGAAGAEDSAAATLVPSAAPDTDAPESFAITPEAAGEETAALLPGMLTPAASAPAAPAPSAEPGVLRSNSYTISLKKEDCDAVVAYLSAVGKSEAAFGRALKTSAHETSASVSLNVTPEEQAAFLSYLKDNAYGEAQGEIMLRVSLTVRG